MATKAQQFKTQAQRTAKPPKTKAPPRPRRDLDVDTSKPGVSATDRRRGRAATAERNVSARAGKDALATLENSASGRPSRKSTRKSPAGVKSGTVLAKQATTKLRTPKVRATKARAR